MIIPNIDYLSATVDIFEYNKTTKDLIYELSCAKAKARLSQSASISNKTLGNSRSRLCIVGFVVLYYTYLVHSPIFLQRSATLGFSLLSILLSI